MRTDLHTLPVSGITVREIEDVLASTAVQGYPIVSNDGQNILMGYIGRAELRYVLGPLFSPLEQLNIDVPAVVIRR